MVWGWAELVMAKGTQSRRCGLLPVNYNSVELWISVMRLTTMNMSEPNHR